MGSWLPLALFGLGMGALMVLLSRWQASRYQEYLQRRSVETAKLVDQQRQTLHALERQTSALERIVTALERDPA